jgi:RNA polymerase sigma factor (sigma-70 family)
MDDVSDAELVRRCRMGEQAAFSLLVTRHETRLRRMLLGVLYSRTDAEDVLQEALLQAYLGIDHLRQPERFGAWLYAIALNMARGQLRERSGQIVPLEGEEGAQEDIRDGWPHPEHLVQQRETHADLERALAELPNAEREAIALVYGDGLSHQETARLLGVSLNAVKLRVHRGRQRLRMALESDYVPANIRSKSHRRKVVMIPVVVHDILATESTLDPRAALTTQLAAMPEITREPFIDAVALNLEPRRPFGWRLHHTPDPSLTLTPEEQQAYEAATRTLWPHRIVLLKERDGLRALPIWIGPFEADALASQLMAQQSPRPLTADLMTSLLRLAGLRVERAVIGKLHDQVFYATLTVHTPEQSAEIDCRPSDAINLAVRLDTPLYVAEEVMEQAGIVPDGDRSYKLDKEHNEQREYHSLIHLL